MTNAAAPYDVAIVGGGPAGLSAALWLARYRRRLCVFDSGEPRNGPARAVHGYPGVPDPPPFELRRRLHDQAIAAGAESVPAGVAAADGERDAFRIYPTAGPPIRARRILLAFGLRDRLPDIAGLDAVYGTAVFHCPDCDGPSVAGCTVGVIGSGRRAAALALYLLTWTDRLILLTHGDPADLDERARRCIADARIPHRTERIARLRAERGRLTGVDLEDGTRLPLDAIFCVPGPTLASNLDAQLGCDHDPAGYLRTDDARETSVRGVYAAGDITGHPHLAISAAADGVRAALAIHRSLLPPEYEL